MDHEAKDAAAAPSTSPPLPAAAGSDPRRARILFAVAFVFTCLVTFFQSRSLFLHPPLYCEDGLFFTHYYNHRAWRELFWFYNGYVSLIPNALAFMVRAFPATFAPYLLSGWALVMGGVSYALFALPRFRALLPSDRARFLCCVLLALWPLGDFAMAHSGVYSLWHLLLVLVLLALVPAPRCTAVEVLLLLVQLLIVMTHPLSLLLVPVWGMTLVRERHVFARVSAALLIAAALAYYAVGIQHRSHAWFSLDAATRTGFVLAVRVFLEAVALARIPDELQASGMRTLAIVLGATIGLGAMAVAFVFRRRFSRTERRVLLVLLYLILSITFVSVVTRALPAVASKWAQRYFYIQHFLFLFGVMFMVHRLAAAWRWTWGRIALALVPVVAWCVFLIGYNRYAWWTEVPRDGARVADFLRRVEAAEDRDAPGPQRVRYGRGYWSLDVTVR